MAGMGTFQERSPRTPPLQSFSLGKSARPAFVMRLPWAARARARSGSELAAPALKSGRVRPAQAGECTLRQIIAQCKPPTGAALPTPGAFRNASRNRQAGAARLDSVTASSSGVLSWRAFLLCGGVAASSLRYHCRFSVSGIVTASRSWRALFGRGGLAFPAASRRRAMLRRLTS